MKETNLDKRPGFWLTLIILSPFILLAEAKLWIRRVLKKKDTE